MVTITHYPMYPGNAGNAVMRGPSSVTPPMPIGHRGNAGNGGVRPALPDFLDAMRF